MRPAKRDEEARGGQADNYPKPRPNDIRAAVPVGESVLRNPAAETAKQTLVAATEEHLPDVRELVRGPAVEDKELASRGIHQGQQRFGRSENPTAIGADSEQTGNLRAAERLGKHKTSSVTY